MDKRSSFKEEQLDAAMRLQEMGIDPDQIMVTYTPEEFHEMYNDPDEEYFELTEENIDAFPPSLIGISSILKNYDFSVNAFSNPFNGNIIDLYIRTITKALMKVTVDDFKPGQLEMQIHIQDLLAKAIQAALQYYTDEYESDVRAYESAVNSMQKTELSSDVRHSKIILDSVVSTKDANERLAKYLQELLSLFMER